MLDDRSEARRELRHANTTLRVPRTHPTSSSDHPVTHGLAHPDDRLFV
jgi:hypothetical protein